MQFWNRNQFAELDNVVKYEILKVDIYTLHKSIIESLSARRLRLSGELSLSDRMNNGEWVRALLLSVDGGIPGTTKYRQHGYITPWTLKSLRSVTDHWMGAGQARQGSLHPSLLASQLTCLVPSIQVTTILYHNNWMLDESINQICYKT